MYKLCSYDFCVFLQSVVLHFSDISICSAPVTPTTPAPPTPVSPVSPGALPAAAKHTCNHLHTIGGVVGHNNMCNRCNQKKWPLMRRGSNRKVERRAHAGEVTVLAVGRCVCENDFMWLCEWECNQSCDCIKLSFSAFLNSFYWYILMPIISRWAVTWFIRTSILYCCTPPPTLQGIISQFAIYSVIALALWLPMSHCKASFI